MEWKLLIGASDVTKYVTALSVSRANNIVGSNLSASAKLALPPNSALPSRCDSVTIQINSNFPSSTAEYKLGTLKFLVKQSALDSEGSLNLELAQINGMGLSKAPVIGEAQRVATQKTAKRAGEIANAMLQDFGVSGALTPFGLPQYDLQGSNGSDPFSQVGAICSDHGLLMYVTGNNGQVKATGLSTLVNQSPIIYPAHVLEFTPIQQPDLDELLVVGLEKTLDLEDRVSYTETETIRDEETGDVKDVITTEVDEFGLESRKVYAAMRFLRPDTHPNSGTLVFAEQSWEEVKSDSQNRITKTIKYVDKNTAVINPESTGDNVLIPAERVETTYRFDKDTNELTSTLIETYQVFVIGKRESYTYSAGGLAPLKVGQVSKPSTAIEAPLTEADKETTVISSLVLARTERTTYRKVGANKWRETLTITARQLNSETNSGTNSESQKTVNRVTTLGGMVTVSSKSKIVYSCPTVQTTNSDTKELKERVFRNLLKSETANSCNSFLTRREQMEISCNVDASAFGQACALARIDKLSPSVAASLRTNSSSVLALCLPFATMIFEGALWLLSNVSLTFGIGGSSDFAADARKIKNTTVLDSIAALPPPKVENTSLGNVFSLPVVTTQIPLVVSGYPELTLPNAMSQPLPLAPNVVGANVPNNQLRADLSQVSGTNTFITEPGKLSVLALDTSQVTSQPTTNFEVRITVGATTITDSPQTNTPTTISLPPEILDEEVNLPTLNISGALFPESVLVEVWEEKEITITTNLMPVSVIVEVAELDITLNFPFFPVN